MDTNYSRAPWLPAEMNSLTVRNIFVYYMQRQMAMANNGSRQKLCCAICSNNGFRSMFCISLTVIIGTCIVHANVVHHRRRYGRASYNFNSILPSWILNKLKVQNVFASESIVWGQRICVSVYIIMRMNAVAGRQGSGTDLRRWLFFFYYFCCCPPFYGRIV